MRSLLSTRAICVTLAVCALVVFGLEKTNDLPRTDRIGQLIVQIEAEEARDAYHASMVPTYCRVLREC